MEKLICEELDAQGMTRTSVREAPRYKWRTCLKMYVPMVCGLAALKAFKARKKKVIGKERKIMETTRKEETNNGFSARRRIFRVWPHSRGSVRGNCLMHREDGTLHR